mgnify:CR=1 FL=1
MIVEILEGRITPERWDSFQQAYRKKLKSIPTQLVQNFLVQDINDETLWRIISIWRDKQSLDETLKKRIYDTCASMFEEVGIEPTYRIFTIRASHTHV